MAYRTIGGYVGKILQINLTDRKVDHRRFDEKLLEEYVGGSGLASMILWDMDVDELPLAGERVFNLKRLFNFRRGISRKDDTLPPRFLTHKATGELPPPGLFLSEYYTYRGWSEEGIPTKKKTKELGLEVTAEFAKRIAG